MLTVRALVRMPDLGLRVLTGGALLDRPVRRIYGTELPDPGRYLSGGELVLSGLLWHRADADCEPFVAALARAEVAALAASAPEGLPEALTDACRRHGVPLVSVPHELSFATIADRVVVALAAADTGARLGSHRRLLTVVARGGGLDDLVAAGAAELGVPCRVVSVTGRVLAGPDLPDVVALVRDHLRTDRQPTVRKGQTLLPVPERDPGLSSWVLVVEGDRRDDGLAVELASLAGVERARRRHAGEVENRVAEPLVREVFAGVDPTARLTALGRPTDVPYRVLSATGLAAPLLADLLPDALVAVLDDVAYALVPDPDRAALVADALHAVEPALGTRRVAVGVSSPTTPGGARGAAEEASHARRLGEQRDDRVCVVRGEEIAPHRLLLAGVPDALRRSLRRRLLGPVLDYDAAHGTDLIGTLRVFLDHSGSWTAAAEVLHVHVNTLRYRVGRVETLLGADLSRFTDRVDLYLALHID
ncbi:PucR family transcriptional regulator ligand-binding domain-containing protein [Actinosynnema sp. NPDC020468]|uniref:helix-turn-helix domain-containing protein n=1 Tax=Actinosynnema sp. NPDC020468 TaxID=3154488 RepID=UPI0033E773AB